MTTVLAGRWHWIRLGLFVGMLILSLAIDAECGCEPAPPPW